MTPVFPSRYGVPDAMVSALLELSSRRHRDLSPELGLGMLQRERPPRSLSVQASTQTHRASVSPAAGGKVS